MLNNDTHDLEIKGVKSVDIYRASRLACGRRKKKMRVVDSRPFQRLRHIHQLAMTFLVYPGATHRRFEHSLGVMELASRV